MQACIYYTNLHKLIGGWLVVHLVHNERTKLTATWFNALATAFIAAGGFAPLAAVLYGISDLRTGGLSAAVVGALCVAVGIVLHMIGWVLLRRLRE
jgi:hypothetical protein